MKKGYVSCLKKRADGPELVRLKLNMAEPRPCRFWNKAKEQVAPPASWGEQPLQLRVLVSHLWVMGSGAQAEFGLLCLVVDAMCERPEGVACPEGFDCDDDDA